MIERQLILSSKNSEAIKHQDAVVWNSTFIILNISRMKYNTVKFWADKIDYNINLKISFEVYWNLPLYYKIIPRDRGILVKLWPN
jgi:hypothetical protein